MANTIYCKTVAKGKQAFYVKVEGRDYYLFSQDYRISNKEFFQNGVTVDRALNHSSSRSEAVRKTMTKLVPYIRYIEQEYDLEVLRKTIKNNEKKKNRKPYKRDTFRWQDYMWEVA